MFEKSYVFLSKIKQNNNREWYHANKDVYNEAKIEFEHVAELLIHETASFDRSVSGLTPKDCIFRIFRDVRFSADKSPYKTNFGCYLVGGGKKSGLAGYYLHIDPDESFIGAGIHMPPSPVLKAIRQEIFEHVDEFKEIIAEKQISSSYDGMFGEKLKNGPKGFDKDFPDIDLLKYKSYGVSVSKNKAEMQAPESLKMIVDTFRTAYPLMQFLNNAIKNGD